MSESCRMFVFKFKWVKKRKEKKWLLTRALCWMRLMKCIALSNQLWVLEIYSGSKVLSSFTCMRGFVVFLFQLHVWPHRWTKTPILLLFRHTCAAKCLCVWWHLSCHWLYILSVGACMNVSLSHSFSLPVSCCFVMVVVFLFQLQAPLTLCDYYCEQRQSRLFVIGICDCPEWLETGLCGGSLMGCCCLACRLCPAGCVKSDCMWLAYCMRWRHWQFIRIPACGSGLGALFVRWV